MPRRCWQERMLSQASWRERWPVLAPMNQASSRRRGIQGAMCSMAWP